jgi:hypothetical protein
MLSLALHSMRTERTKPVTRDEIRFDGQNILTLPVNATRRLKKRKSWWSEERREPIRRLWAPLLRSLNRAQKRDWENGAAEREEYARTVKPSYGWKPPEPPEPIDYPWPDGRSHRCCHCGGKFFRVYRSGSMYCSDRCARAVRSARESRQKSEQRARERADRVCEVCREPFEAQRSTARYCSTRCRVRGHRARP